MVDAENVFISVYVSIFLKLRIKYLGIHAKITYTDIHAYIDAIFFPNHSQEFMETIKTYKPAM